MAFGNLSSVLNIFGGSSTSDKTQDEFYKEVYDVSAYGTELVLV